MGCCLTKKSRVRNKGLNETLLTGEGDSDGDAIPLNPSRGNRNGYAPVQIPGNDSHNAGVSLANTKSGGSAVLIDGLDNKKPSDTEVTRKVVGTSLLVLPSIKSLKKTGWLLKRGHMVGAWDSERVSHYRASIEC
jgi:hypothetical protein